MWIIEGTFVLLLLHYEQGLVYSSKEGCNIQSCNPTKPGLLNVHVIIHTHLDAGWLRTFDDYYERYVKDIIDAMVRSVPLKKSRRFVFVETAFLSRWWEDQDDLMKHKFNGLIKSGQLELAGGGWVTNDEATPYYLDIIDQMTLGLTWLRDTFGECSLPTIGWQIDPFGHSKEMASIMAQMAFDALFFCRIDTQDEWRRTSAKSLEFIWKSNANLGGQSNIFTGVLPAFYNRALELFEDPKWLFNHMQSCGEKMRTDHTMVLLGNDFHLKDEHWFQALDSYIESMNSWGEDKVHVLYSTPSCYLRALREANISWPIKRGDFFPYSSRTNVYWTGYFTSRPSQKYLVKLGHNVLQAAKQLHVFAGLGQIESAKVRELKKAMGILQHHDAITGTSRQLVADDYVRIVSSGIREAQDVISDAFEGLLGKDLGSTSGPFSFCNFINESVCEPTESMADESGLFIVAYNPLAYHVTHFFRFPVEGSGHRVSRREGLMSRTVVSQLVPNLEAVNGLPGRGSQSTHEITFASHLPSLGFALFHLDKGRDTHPHQMPGMRAKDIDREIIIRGSKLRAAVDFVSGLLTWVSLGSGLKVKVKQNFYLYPGTSSAAGAYSFIAGSESPHPLVTNVMSVKVIRGPVVQEIHQSFNEWISQVIRIYRDADYVEFDWVVGPVPVDNGIGSDVVTKFDTDLVTRGVFYTDANGRQTMRRERNKREDYVPQTSEKASSNYYPVTSWIYIQDTERDVQVTLFPDKAQGGGSISDGSLELAVHRRFHTDDGPNYWLPGSLNELGPDGAGLVVRGRHRLLVNSIDKSIRKMKRKSKHFALQPIVAFKKSPTNSFPANEPFRGLNTALPQNVHLLTLESLNEGRVLLRLEHVYEWDVDSVHSKPVTIDLGTLFKQFTVTAAYETTLSGIQGKQEVDRNRHHWLQDDNGKESPRNEGMKGDRIKLTETSVEVTLYPMEIVTLALHVFRK